MIGALMFEKNMKISYLLDFYGDVLDERVRSVMDAYYDDDLSLSEIADRFYHSKYHVCHLFREQVGVTLGDYLVLRRIHLVNDLIRRGDPVTEACFAAGFKNYSNFFRLYKKHTGMTPLEFKNSIGK